MLGLPVGRCRPDRLPTLGGALRPRQSGQSQVLARTSPLLVPFAETRRCHNPRPAVGPACPRVGWACGAFVAQSTSALAESKVPHSGPTCCSGSAPSASGHCGSCSSWRGRECAAYCPSLMPSESQFGLPLWGGCSIGRRPCQWRRRWGGGQDRPCHTHCKRAKSSGQGRIGIVCPSGSRTAPCVQCFGK